MFIDFYGKKDIEKIIDHILSGNEEELSEYEPGSINWIDLVPDY